MARFYHADIAAVVADVDLKWVDNLLSHFDIPGVESSRQGVARRLSLDAIRTIALVRTLSQEPGLPIDRSVALASMLLATPDGRVATNPWVSINLDRVAFQREVDQRVTDAAESVVPRRRGRPPRRGGGK